MENNEHTIEFKVEKRQHDGNEFLSTYLLFDGFLKIYFDFSSGNIRTLTSALYAGHTISVLPSKYKLDV